MAVRRANARSLPCLMCPLQLQLAQLRAADLMPRVSLMRQTISSDSCRGTGLVISNLASRVLTWNGCMQGPNHSISRALPN